MQNEFENFRNWQSWFWLVIKWMLWLLFRPLLDILKLIKQQIINNIINKKWKDLWLAIIPIILIISFVIYWFSWLYKDLNKFIFSERYEKLIIETYKHDIEDFFKKYEERFLDHDCWFMREVWADELMFDKYWKTSYWDDYKCTIFDSVQRVKLLPITIWEIEKSWKKLKVRWELIRIDITDWKPLSIAPIRFELWKSLDMELWHFNLYWDPNNRWIESEFKEY